MQNVDQDSHERDLNPPDIAQENERVVHEEPLAESRLHPHDQPYEDTMRFLEGNIAFDWMLNRIRRVLLMTRGVNLSATSTLISSGVWRASRHVETASPSLCTKYHVDWDPVRFLREQYVHRTALGDVIVLTSDEGHVQVALLRDYIQQIWPVTGPPFLKALEQWLISRGNEMDAVFERTRCCCFN